VKIQKQISSTHHPAGYNAGELLQPQHSRRWHMSEQANNANENKAPMGEALEIENKVRTALRQVYDPELGMSVVELGLIRKLDVTPNEVNVTMILTTPFCPYGPAMVEQVKQTVQEASERVAKITMGLEMWEPTMMEDQAAANWGLYY
jgi:metal-sulfur cluster biosynthetic enzyme